MERRRDAGDPDPVQASGPWLDGGRESKSTVVAAKTAPQASGHAMRLGETCIPAGCPVLQWNRGFCRVRMAVFARNCSIFSFRLHFCRFAGSVFRIIFPVDSGRNFRLPTFDSVRGLQKIVSHGTFVSI